MYRPQTSIRDRAGSIVLVVLIHAGLLYAFLNLSGRMPELVKQANLQLIDILNPPPPPPPPPVVAQAKAKPKKAEGAAAPKAIESKATPVVRPIPKVVIPVPPKIVTAPTPGTGAAATQGASTPGPGTGAGGAGSGTGGGGAGSGSGGGGGGGMAVRPALLRGITNHDYPEAIQRGWPRGGQVFVRVRVEANGRPSKCDVMRSFGDPSVDQWTCSLVMNRATFRPATDAGGRPVSAWFGYVQSDQGRFER